MEDLFHTKKSAFVFESCQKRPLFPFNLPKTRIGTDMPSVTSANKLGPGYYKNEEMSNFSYNLANKLASTKGYTLGARTAQRFRVDLGDGVVGPGSYEPADSFRELQKQVLRDRQLGRPPFLSGTQRFPVFKRDVLDVTPSPGKYEHETGRSRKVQWQQSFGGEPSNLPSAEQQSTLAQNTDKLRSTKEEKKHQRRLAYLRLYY